MSSRVAGALARAGAPGRLAPAAPALRVARRGAAGGRKDFAEDPRRHSFAERGYVARDAPRAHRYWPLEQSVGEEPVMLPGGRKAVAVRAMRSDVDGDWEAQVVFTTRGGHRLFWLNEEELTELEKLAPRMTEYLALWKEKAEHEQELEEESKLQPEVAKIGEKTMWE